MADPVEREILTASDAADSDYFGKAVAFSADGAILAVGAYNWEGANTNQGGVYIYDRTGGAWVQRGSVLTASDAAAYDNFGSALALSADGTVLVVGAPSWEGSGAEQGGVYVYDWSGSAWTQRGSVLTASDSAAYDTFGSAVALSSDGSVLVVGAPAWEGTSSDQGGVYVYDWSGSAWTMRGSVLTASDKAASDNFGRSVALSSDGDVLAVGATQWEGGSTNQGGVYIYDWSGSAWTQRGSVLTASDAAASDKYGWSVALSADAGVLAVGAALWEDAIAEQGGVYVYDWSGSAWTQRGSVLTAADAVASDYFGECVALTADGTLLAVGAVNREGSVQFQGAVYVYDYSTTGKATAPVEITVVDTSGSATAPIEITVSASTGQADAPITISVIYPTGQASAAVTISVAHLTGRAEAPIAVAVTDAGAASAPVRVTVADSLGTGIWSAAVALDGVDVSARLTGAVRVDAEEGAARVASFALLPAAGAIDPVAWTGQAVTIDLIRTLGGASFSTRLFTGRVDEAVFDVSLQEVAFQCTDDLQNRVAALDRPAIDTLTGGLYHAGAQGELDDNWDYAQACMAARAGSLDAGAHGQLRVTDWAAPPLFATFDDADILDATPAVTLPRRQSLVNRVDVAYEYRYYRCRERRAAIGWSKSAFGVQADASGYQYPTQIEIQSALDGCGWHVLSASYSPAPTAIASTEPGYHYAIPAGSVASFVARVAQRHAQGVTEAYSLTVSNPASIAANGSLARPLRGALATDWEPAEWEQDFAVTTPDASAADVDYAGSETRAESDQAVEVLLAMANTTILASHRQARVSFSLSCTPDLDLTHAAAVDTDRLTAQGKVARLEHVLDILDGTATTRVTLAVSGIAAGGLLTPDDLDAPAPPDATPDETDAWESRVPHLANNVGLATITSYSTESMGYLCNAPKSMTATNGTDTVSIPNSYYDASAAQVPTGFRLQMPGVQDSHRNPLSLSTTATYSVAIPEDPLTLTVE